MKTAREQVRESFSFTVPHEVLLVEPDGTESYRSELPAGPTRWAGNWVAYTTVVEAQRVLGGKIIIRPIEGA